jgi:hypothetical protein
MTSKGGPGTRGPASGTPKRTASRWAALSSGRQPSGAMRPAIAGAGRLAKAVLAIAAWSHRGGDALVGRCVTTRSRRRQLFAHRRGRRRRRLHHQRPLLRAFRNDDRFEVDPATGRRGPRLAPMHRELGPRWPQDDSAAQPGCARDLASGRGEGRPEPAGSRAASTGHVTDPSRTTGGRAPAERGDERWRGRRPPPRTNPLHRCLSGNGQSAPATSGSGDPFGGRQAMACPAGRSGDHQRRNCHPRPAPAAGSGATFGAVSSCPRSSPPRPTAGRRARSRSRRSAPCR